MKFQTKNTVLLILLSVALNNFGCSFFSRKAKGLSENDRIQFVIRAIEESNNQKKIISETTVEGLPGTDFNINLKTERFTMQAKFLSDLIAPDKISVRTNLSTRRFYGLSERKLPLYEEDAQKLNSTIGFDQTIVLLPFGRNNNESSLKIEITPKRLSASEFSSSEEPLKININKPDPNGEITIEAFKIPHRFKVEAVLLADGREVARSSGDYLLEEPREITLQTNEQAAPEIVQPPLAVKFEINRFTAGYPSNLVGVNFQVFRSADVNQNQMISNGSGIGILGKEFEYELSQMPEGKKYHLKFRINLAEGEIDK